MSDIECPDLTKGDFSRDGEGFYSIEPSDKWGKYLYKWYGYTDRKPTKGYEPASKPMAKKYTRHIDGTNLTCKYQIRFSDAEKEELIEAKVKLDKISSGDLIPTVIPSQAEKILFGNLKEIAIDKRTWYVDNIHLDKGVSQKDILASTVSLPPSSNYLPNVKESGNSNYVIIWYTFIVERYDGKTLAWFNLKTKFDGSGGK